MLDLKLIREQPEFIRESLRKRHMDVGVVNQILEQDETRRALILEVEAKKAERNAVSKEIGSMKDAVSRQEKIDAMRALGDSIAALDEKLKAVEAELHLSVAGLPNIPDPDVPIGVDDKDNIVVRTIGKKPAYDFEPQAHWDLGPRLGMINFEAGVRLAGTRFYVLEGAGARLERALIFWMLDLHIRQGYRGFTRPGWCARRSCLPRVSCPNLRITFITTRKKIFGWCRLRKCR
jgi:seryl-tRNA synthetase